MVDVSNWVDLALKVWDPSSRNKGLPFGSLLHATPPKRQRTLTGPLDTSQDSFWHKIQVLSSYEPERLCYLQEQCNFLSMLPLDIRIIIYEMVFGGMVFHITKNTSDSNNSDFRILSHICKRPDHINEADHFECFDSSSRRPSSAPRRDYPHATGLLPLLVSCRRIYSEAIDTLYSANAFEFWENRVALKFLKVVVPPQRLSSIRHFRWNFRIPHHPDINSRSQKDWSDLFTFFSDETSGLQHLYLKLMLNYPIEAEIQRTRDEEAFGWIRPMIVMAVDANRKRGCKVEIVTNGVVHEPDGIFKDITKAHPEYSYTSKLVLACTEMHRRIRVSLDSHD